MPKTVPPKKKFFHHVIRSNMLTERGNPFRKIGNK